MTTKSKTVNNRYLKLHHDTWVYCRRIPKALQHLYPNKTNLTISLKTSSVKIARMERDRINGQLATQVQGSYSSERVEFKQYVEQLKPYVGALQQADSAIDYDDVLPRNEIAKAAYRQELYGEHQHAFTYTLKEGLNSRLARENKLTSETVGKLTNSVERFLLFLKVPDVPLREIHKKQVVEYVEHLGLQYAHGTISAHLSRLKSVWVHAYKLGEVDTQTSPFCYHDLSKYLGDESTKKQLFSSCQLKQILQDSPDSVKDLVRLGLFTGARIGDLCKAYEEIIDGVRCMVIKTGKTKAARRIVPLPSRLHDISLPLGLEVKAAGRIFSRFKVASITNDRSRSFHSLRVHFISAAQRAHASEFNVAKAVGHKSGHTMSYGYYARENLPSIAKTMDIVAEQIDKEWLV
ncbi:site-specific integrase [Vibrio parahaemolyticus]|nr:site-specific integrase [Vibrio parahaemolyticus]